MEEEKEKECKTPCIPFSTLHTVRLFAKDILFLASQDGQLSCRRATERGGGRMARLYRALMKSDIKGRNEVGSPPTLHTVTICPAAECQHPRLLLAIWHARLMVPRHSACFSFPPPFYSAGRRQTSSYSFEGYQFAFNSCVHPG